MFLLLLRCLYYDENANTAHISVPDIVSVTPPLTVAVIVTGDFTI